MEKKHEPKLEKFLANYFKEIHKIYTGGDFREESFYPSFKRLFEDCSKLLQTQADLNVLVAPRKTEAGIPDLQVRKNGRVVQRKGMGKRRQFKEV